MVDVFLHDDFVVAVSIHYNLYIGVFCFLCFVRGIIACCVTGTSVLELLCDILCIHEGCLTVYRSILAVADLIWCCFLQAYDGCFSIPIRKYGGYITCRGSLGIQLLILISLICSSLESQRICCLSRNGRIIIRHFHFYACRQS